MTDDEVAAKIALELGHEKYWLKPFKSGDDTLYEYTVEELAKHSCTETFIAADGYPSFRSTSIKKMIELVRKHDKQYPVQEY